MTTLTWDPHIGTHRAEVERRMKEHQAAWSYSYKAKQRRARFWAEHGRYCDRCGWADHWTFHKRHLEVHHVNYDHPAGDEPDSALRGLCTRCHDAVHTRHRRRYVWHRPYRRRDHFPYEHLEHVTASAIRRGWWRRILRTKPT